jgi:hypothetical protein
MNFAKLKPKSTGKRSPVYLFEILSGNILFNDDFSSFCCDRSNLQLKEKSFGENVNEVARIAKTSIAITN